VTHWWGSPNADPAFLFLAAPIITAMYPEAVVTSDQIGNVIAKTAGGALIAAVGPHQHPVNGVWSTVQTPEGFMAAMGLTRIEGTLSGDAASDQAISKANSDEPFTNTPGDALDAEVVEALVARLTAALTQALPEGGRNIMSKQLGIGGAIAQAFINKYGVVGL
jgi:hypothetical protein